MPGRAAPARTRGPRTPRCWPAPAPAADCGSPWSATRSWSPPRPGRRVALSSGGRVVARAARSGARRRPAAASAHEPDPDVVLLTGGTDGGNAERSCRPPAALVAGGWSGPVVVAGNVDARDEVARDPRPTSRTCVADNVVPRIGVLAPDSARAAIREMFLSHVIGGKHLSKRADFTAMVTGATPDVVLTGVELLARGLDRRLARCRRRRRRRRRRRHHRRALVVELDPEDAGARPRGGRHHAGDPHRRGRPRDALVGGHHTAEAAGLDDLAEAARRAARRPRLRPRPTTPSATSTRRSPRRPSGWPCAGTPAAARSWSAPRAGS